MKRLFISLAAILCVAATASAQTLIVVEEKPVLTNKKGAPILPQAGDRYQYDSVLYLSGQHVHP